jgi:predicted phage terminase large subunit-like protein
MNLSPTELGKVQALLNGLTLEKIEAELGRRDLWRFVQLAWPQVEPATPLDKTAWHIPVVCDHLQAVTEGKIKRLLINIPPAFGKSLITAVFWPVWEWVRDPTVRFLGLSYAEDLAMRDLVRSRRLIESPWFQDRWPLAFTMDQNTKHLMENERGGYRAAAGFEGSITGKRCSRMLIDDPHNAGEVLSDVKRQAAIYTFNEVLPTRVDDPKTAAVVIIMQRLHMEDLSGHVLATGKWEHLRLPMRYEADDRCFTSLPFKDPRRIDGQLLWPNRWGEEEVDDLETTLGPFAAPGQLQQRPIPRGGGMFAREKAQIVTSLPPDMRYVRFWDHAATQAKGLGDPDWRVGLRLAIADDGKVYVSHVTRGRWAPADTRKILRTQAESDGTSVIVCEEEQVGSAGKEMAYDHMTLLHGFAFYAIKPTGAKEVRAEPIAAQWGAGNVYLMAGEWNAPFLDEVCVFPAGKHDDQVDALSGAYNYAAEFLRGGGGEAIIAKRQGGEPEPGNSHEWMIATSRGGW